MKLFQPTRPLRGATSWGWFSSYCFTISTHAPLAGRDISHVRIMNRLCVISTHAPLAGRDSPLFWFYYEDPEFQPTRPLRGATIGPLVDLTNLKPFQPTRPLRGATALVLFFSALSLISTHAPLAGRDNYYDMEDTDYEYFNPRAPCGARRATAVSTKRGGRFQPTRPLRGATPTTAAGGLETLYFNPRAPCGARQ